MNKIILNPGIGDLVVKDTFIFKGGVFIVKNTITPLEEEISWSKAPKHLLLQPSWRRRQLGLEEEEFSCPIMDHQNTVVFWWSILAV